MCLELTMALVNSYEDTMDQEHFALRYEFFSCDKYLSHSGDILVDQRKKKGTYATAHFCI